MPDGLRACDIAPLAPEDLLALEGGLTTAILAGLRGFHRGEFERRGTWADVLARTAHDAGDFRESGGPGVRESGGPEVRESGKAIELGKPMPPEAVAD